MTTATKFEATGTRQSIDIVPNTFELAQYASIVLSGDKGIPNEIFEIPNGHRVIIDTGDFFDFVRK